MYFVPFCIFEIFESGLPDKRLFVFVGIFGTHPASAPGHISPGPLAPGILVKAPYNADHIKLG
jgi:hypothetical protein